MLRDARDTLDRARAEDREAEAALENAKGIRCYCGELMTIVVDTRRRKDAIWRRRECPACHRRSTTKETAA